MIGAGWPAPRWYYWCDAWIFVGSMVATYAMARGWNDFWLAWIAVDLVGVPLLWHSQLLPDRDPVRRLRRPRGLGLRRLAAAPRRRRAEPELEEVARMSAPDSVRLDTVERAIADIAAGKAVVVVDDEDRENEGDLIFAASKATPELMAFTIRHTCGVICVPMPAAMLDRLEIPLMTPHNRDRMRTAYTSRSTPATASRTGISRRRPRAHRAGAGRLGDRAVRAHPARATSSRCATARAACWSGRGHTEAAVDLARLAGLDAGRRARRGRQRRRHHEARARSCASSPTSTAWR